MPSLKTIVRLLALSFAGLTLMACDPSYNVEFEVHNETDAPIQVITIFPGAPFQDTSLIATGTQLVFFWDSGLGYTTEDYMDMLENLPVGITISNRNGVMYKKDENDLSLWDQTYPNKSEGIGRVYLRVKNVDFE